MARKPRVGKKKLSARRPRGQTELRRWLSILPVGAYTCDAEGLITYYNDHAVELWQRAPALNDPLDRFCGSFKLYAIDGTPISHEKCWMALALRDGREYNGHPIVIERADGSRITALAHANPLRDSQGRIVGAVNLLVNINDRTRAEQTQALLAAIVESSDDAILSKTLDGRILSWNVGAERLFGYSAAEVVGQPITLLIPTDRHGEEQMILARLREGKRIEHYETVRIDKQGRAIDVSLTASPIRDGSGRAYAVSSVVRDITARRQAQAALDASRERFRALANNARAAIFVKDLDGRYTIANPVTCEVLGQSGSIVGRTDHELLPPEIADALRQRDLEVISSRRPIEVEEVIRRAGSERWFLSVKFPMIGNAGEPEGVCGVAIDITDRKLAEQALRQADQRKDEFLATLAHELRNPLAPISNSLHILRMAQDIDPAIQRVHEIMERQTNYLVRLVEDLLDVSRIAQNKIELRTELVDLAAVVRSAVETSRPLVEAGGHQLAISLPPEAITLEADPVRLAQVLTNLLNNAAKYTPQGGQIWLTGGQDDAGAFLCVRDNGVGIAPEMLPRVFEKFAQLGAPQTRPHGGLGIGLALAKSLVELHGGRLEGHSDGIGRGSQFTIRLPLARQARSADERQRAPLTRSATPLARRVLVVDDARDSAFILGRLLEAIGQRVLTARDGFSALDIARAERPDVVISDIAMADMDGYELARRLRQLPGLERMLLVALTGYSQDSDRQRARDAGFDHHLVKPVNVQTLERLFATLGGPENHPL
jgi:PAS domain S-box-containing protein